MRLFLLTIIIIASLASCSKSNVDPDSKYALLDTGLYTVNSGSIKMVSNDSTFFFTAPNDHITVHVILHSLNNASKIEIVASHPFPGLLVGRGFILSSYITPAKGSTNTQWTLGGDTMLSEGLYFLNSSIHDFVISASGSATVNNFNSDGKLINVSFQTDMVREADVTKHKSFTGIIDLKLNPKN